MTPIQCRVALGSTHLESMKEAEGPSHWGLFPKGLWVVVMVVVEEGVPTEASTFSLLFIDHKKQKLEAEIQIPAPPLPSCVTSGKFSNLSEPPMVKGANNGTQLRVVRTEGDNA